MEKEPDVGKVPHRSLFDRSLHNIRKTNLKREKLEFTEKNEEMCDIEKVGQRDSQDLEVSQLSEFPRYSSSEHVAVEPPVILYHKRLRLRLKLRLGERSTYYLF